MSVHLIPVGNVSPYLPVLVEQFERVCQAHPDKYDVDYWLAQIYNGTYRLWGLFGDAQLEGILLTAYRQYPKKRVLFFSSAATEPHVFEKHMDDVFNVLTRFGQENGCAGVEFEGRPGWQKMLKDRGFAVDNVVYGMTFGEFNE